MAFFICITTAKSIHLGMHNKLLQAAYTPEDFREKGHQLIDELANHLEKQLYDEKAKTLDWHFPEDEYAFWKQFLVAGDKNELFSQLLQRITNVHNPKCIGHQVTPTIPITALTAMMSGMLNNGMAVYEMGMAPTAIERIVTDILCKKLGYTTNSGGFLTSGGTLANLTALLAARKAKASSDVWVNGHKKALGVMVCEEAHYCIARAAKIMGLGEKGVIKIPSTEAFKMNTASLEAHLNAATANNIEVFAIIGSAPSTATGIYDDLETIAAFSKKHNLWFHVDGAHGGAAIFSQKYKHTVAGIQDADSVVIDGHKMMMMPAITTALLFKDREHSHTTFSQKADYLLTQSEDEDWYNLAKRTFECTKIMMSIHWYTLFKTYGEEIFDQYVTQLYDMGAIFGDIITNEPNFELAVKPVSNIVCFRYINDNLDTTTLNKINRGIRQQLLEDGTFYIVQTTLKDKHYMRCTVMNPFTTVNHFKQLLAVINEIISAKNLIPLG